MLQPLAAIVPDSGSILNKPSYTTVVKFDDEQEVNLIKINLFK